MEGDWKKKLSVASRRKIVVKLVETFQKHLGLKSSRNIRNLLRILQRFEAKALNSAQDKGQYLEKISRKVLLLETLLVDLLVRETSGDYDRRLTQKEELPEHLIKEYELYKLMRRMKVDENSGFF